MIPLLRVLLHPSSASPWQMRVLHDRVSVQKSGGNKFKTVAFTRSLFDAVQWADAAEWDRLEKGWMPLHLSSVSLAAGPPSLAPLWHPELNDLLPATRSAVKRRKEAGVELYDLAEYATSRIQSAWVWDHPATTAGIISRAAPELMALWSVLSANGQICNGGFNQFFFNSQGELAEHALTGFERLGLADCGRVFEAACSLIQERPIPTDRDRRIAWLDALAWNGRGKRPAILAASPTGSIKHFSTLATANAQHWSTLEREYYDLIHRKDKIPGYNAAFFQPLCTFISENLETFFQCDATEAPVR